MSIERELRTNWDTVYYPEPEPMVEEAMAPGQQPGDVLVAEAGSRGLPESAYSGEPPKYPRMEAYDPTTREKLSNKMQTWLESMGVDRYKARQNAQTFMGGGSSNLPLTMGIADFLPFVGTGLQTEEAARLGSEAVTSAQQGNIGTAAVQAGGAALGLIPGVAGTMKVGKALAPKAGEMAIKSMEKLGTPVQMGIVPPSPSTATKALAPASDLGFYSAVEKAALNVQRKSGTGQSFLNDITKGENVKADEIKWIGLDDFLKGKKNVTKEDVQNFIAENKIDVQEVTLSDMRKEAMESLTNMSKDELANTYKQVMSFDIGGEYGRNWYTRKNEVIDEIMNPEMESNYLDLFMQSKNALSAKYEKYQLPGGENYREILLTLPNKGVGASEDLIDKINTRLVNKGFDGLGEEQRNVISKGGNEAIDMLIDLQDRVGIKTDDIQKSMAGGDPSKQYRSSHFDQPNILAHIRVNDRVDADGKKMLLIEEVQSDWHQAGREKGYQFKPKKTTNPDGTVTVDFGNNQKTTFQNNSYADDAIQTATLNIRGSVPDAPFKDTWYQLALKRALRYAADNGYDRVGLTTGKQQAERYDLSKQIGQINARPTPDGKISLEALTPDMGEQVIQTVVKADELDNIVGKEIADKIRTQIEYPKSFDDVGKSVELTGLDLKVGGEGMKKYYDDIYPKYLDKYGKKWGASVGETRIKTGRGVPGGEPVRYLDITPEMRKSVQKGQPLAAVSGETTVA